MTNEQQDNNAPHTNLWASLKRFVNNILWRTFGTAAAAFVRVYWLASFPCGSSLMLVSISVSLTVETLPTFGASYLVLFLLGLPCFSFLGLSVSEVFHTLLLVYLPFIHELCQQAEPKV